MIAAEVKAKITCVDPSQLARSFAGRDYDEDLLAPRRRPVRRKRGVPYVRLDAPAFSRPIAVGAGEVVERDGFVFADVLPE